MREDLVTSIAVLRLLFVPDVALDFFSFGFVFAAVYGAGRVLDGHVGAQACDRVRDVVEHV